MTQDQIILLLNLRDSQARGATSMSCSEILPHRGPIARELKKIGLVELHQIIGGTPFYRINQKGLAALKKTERPLSRNEIREVEQALEKAKNRLAELEKTSKQLNKMRHA